MAVRGEITFECDTPTCHAEIVVTAERAREVGDIAHDIWDEGWRVGVPGDAKRIICPACVKEGK
jgi:hypothetical protein